jgi:Ca-activated chloride channel family protein
LIEFAWPWAGLAAVLPLLVWQLAPAAPAGAALRVPFFDAARSWRGAGRGRPGTGRVLLGTLAWTVLVAAACRPQWVGDPVDLPVTGRDLMLGVPQSRLQVVKGVAGDFLHRRLGDRVGLILFGTRPYLQAPLTFDLATVRSFLEESEVGLAGDQTAIGDAIGLAVKRLEDRPGDQRVLVLLTDGANTAGTATPEAAARVAARLGVTIYTIGVGADEMAVRSFLGTRRVNPSRDLDEATLEQIAALTGGRYFRARDTADLESVYALLDRLEPAAKESAVLRPRREVFHWPLAAALLGFALLAGAPTLPGPRRTARRDA